MVRFRGLAHDGKAEQAHDLADAFHKFAGVSVERFV
jgi:hypothetical protein